MCQAVVHVPVTSRIEQLMQLFGSEEKVPADVVNQVFLPGCMS